MQEAQRFPYVEIDPSLGAASSLPYAPITLELGGNAASVSALINSLRFVWPSHGCETIRFL